MTFFLRKSKDSDRTVGCWDVRSVLPGTEAVVALASRRQEGGFQCTACLRLGTTKGVKGLQVHILLIPALLTLLLLEQLRNKRGP